MKLLALNRFKFIGVLSMMVVGSSLLSGCADIMQKLQLERKPLLTTDACANAAVLITNLKANTNYRQYQLENGNQCTEVHNYEKVKLPATSKVS
jgi:hypothetical protein